MKQKIELKIDVSNAVPLPGPHEIAATIYLPEPGRLPSPPIVMFASPGGGYTRQYFDLHFAGHAGYSEAEFHAAEGIIYVAYDHLAVGESSLQNIDKLTSEMLADANHAMVLEVISRLEKGNLDAKFPAISKPFSVGTGQSMGAGLTIIMQGRNRSFDAVGILGVSGIHTQLPQPTFEAARQAKSPYRFTRSTTPKDLSITRTAAQVPDFKYPFHWEDIPQDILDADMQGGYPIRDTAPYFGSRTIPICAVAMNSPGYFTPEASMIEVPVFIGVGERDVCPNPWLEPSAYWSRKDVSIYVVPQMAHMHNFASTRELLWRRLGQWSSMVAADKPLV